MTSAEYLVGLMFTRRRLLHVLGVAVATNLTTRVGATLNAIAN